jgi:phosphatidylglycerol---prolipoprotein diacylglyceryl transferase
MLPVLYEFRFDTPFAQAVLYLLGVLFVAYGTWAGWRSAVGALDPKTGVPRLPTRSDQAKRALIYGVIFAAAVKFGFSYFLPATVFLGGRGEGLPLHTYGLLLMTGFLCAVAVAARLAEREWPGAEGRKKREQMHDLALWVFIGGIGGSKILYLLVNLKEAHAGWGDLFTDPVRVLGSLFGGLVFYGGLLGAMGTSYWFARRHGIPFLRLADLAIPTVSLGQCVGRLGCFSAGCCWGRPAAGGLFWGVHFPGSSLAKNLLGSLSHTASLAYQSQSSNQRWVVETTGKIFQDQVPGAVRISDWMAIHGTTLPLHPTQLYESIGQLFLFCFLVVMRRYRRFHGEILALYLMLYAVLRTTVELFRGDLERGTLHGLLEDWLGTQALAARVPPEAWYNVSTSQGISLIMFAIGAALMVRGLRGVEPLPPLPAAPVPASV